MTERINLASDNFGQKGFDVMTTGTEADTDATRVKWYAIQVTGNAAATIDAVTTLGDDLTNKVLANGQIIYGTFSSITVDDGEIIAYRIEG